MLIYRLTDDFYSQVFYADDEMAALAMASGMLKDWWADFLDRSETRVLHAKLYIEDVIGGEEGEWEYGWMLITGITVTIDAVAPPCIDEDGHDWAVGYETASFVGVMLALCHRCGVQHTTDRRHLDPVTYRTYLWEHYSS